ncbi:MAG: Na(+)/H(+) antiporter subunit B [Pseudomonadales bacterium]|nr:Na(+)/H(+) antiporter subunit B [Pseudomonadales bacterium]
MKEHMIVRVVSKVLMPLMLLYALYVQFHGEYGPGGGFQAGVIFAEGVILYSMLFGEDLAHRVISRGFIHILAALGVLLYGGVGVASIVLGKNFLNYDALAEDPVTGQVMGIILVELGVGVTVASMMMLIFFSFSDRQNIRRIEP